MGLQRVGVMLFGVGLLLASVSAVVGGVACTERACPGQDPGFSLVGVDSTSGSVLYSDGCNQCRTHGGVGIGLALLGVGALAGGAGVIRELAEGSE